MMRERNSWWQRNKYYVVASCACAAGGLAAVRLYQSKSLEATQASVLQTLQAIQRYSEACVSAGDAVALLSRDVQDFLQSDSDDVPQSLRQLAKLAQCPEVQAAITASVASAVEGGSTAMLKHGGADNDPTQLSMVDKILEAFLSDRGRSLVGLAVSVAARQSTEAFCAAVRQAVDAAFTPTSSSSMSSADQALSVTISSHPNTPSRTPLASPARSQHQQRHHGQEQQQQPSPPLTQASALLCDVLSWLTSPPAERLFATVTSTGISSAVSTYMQHANPQDLWNPLLSAISQPEHKQALIEIMSTVSSSFCREMAAACIAPASTVAGSLSPSRAPLAAFSRAVTPGLPAMAAAAGSGAVAGAAGPLCNLSSLHQIHNQQQLRTSSSRGSLAAAEDELGSSLPSTPRSGPGTPDPSLIAAQAVVPSHLIHRHRGQQGLGVGSSSIGTAGSGGSSFQYQQQQQMVGALQPAAADTVMLGPASSVISLLVQASRFEELRSLMVEVSRSSTHEFVASVFPAVSAAGLMDPRYVVTFKHYMYRVYVMLSVLVFLGVYALGPKHMLEGA